MNRAGGVILRSACSILESAAVSGEQTLLRTLGSAGVRSLSTFSQKQSQDFSSLRPIQASRFTQLNFRTIASSAACLNVITYPSSEAFVGQPAPDFHAPAIVDGEITKIALSDYTKQGKYVVLFFYPKDFTFVCPTEIIAFSDRAKEFEAANIQLIAASTDTEECHLAWIKTPRTKGGLGRMQIPIIADTTKEISAKYGVLLPKLGIALRGLYVIDPKGLVRHITVNDLPIGRSVDEALRVVQAIQFHAEHGEVCPADWKPGQKTMIADPEKSLDYFGTVKESEPEWGQKLPALKSKKEFDDLLASGGPVVVDFYAPWCGKCRQIAPFVEGLMEKYPKVKFVKVDTTDDALQGLSSELGVKVLPTFKFFKGGKEALESVSGYKKKPLEEAVEKLK